MSAPTPDSKYWMFIDDLRDAEKYFSTPMVTVRSYYEAVEYVNKHGLPSFISFDHDLGDENEPEMTGYSFAKFLIDYIIDNNIRERFAFNVHSANPVGAANITSYIENAYRALKI